MSLYTMKMKFFGPTSDQKIIREVNLDFHEKDNVGRMFEEMDFTVGGSDTADSFTVTETKTEGG